MPEKNTNDRIIEIAQDILASDGVAAVSFDAIARRLGRSKQAVLYWYPTKPDLLAALFLPWLEEEAGMAIRAVSDAPARADAIRAFVGAIFRFHLDNLDRFRMMYLVPQTIRPGGDQTEGAAVLQKVHPVTDRMYGALAGKLEGSPVAARQKAFAIHSAVLGLVLMIGLADGVGDPLKHAPSDLLDALVATLDAA